MRSRDADNVRGLFGLVLIVGGLLIMALCGLCTATGLLFGASESAPWILVVAVVMGGVPAGIGFLVYRAGRRLWTTPRPRTAPAGTDKP